MQRIDCTKTYEVTVKLSAQLTTPAGFDPARESLPLIVFLHGMGERAARNIGELSPEDAAADFDRVAIHGVAKLFRADPDYTGVRAVTLSPQCPGNTNWNDVSDALFMLIEDVVRDYNIDKRKISLTGLSMGGFGTWETAMRHPDYFSAIAPICGGGASFRASVLRDNKIWAFHGDSDDVVPTGASEDMVNAVRAAGGTPMLTIVPNTGHNSWDYAYEQTELIKWLAEAVR